MRCRRGWSGIPRRWDGEGRVRGGADLQLRRITILCSLQGCSDVAELGHSCDVSAEPTLRQQAESACHRLLEKPFAQCHIRVSQSEPQSVFFFPPNSIMSRTSHIAFFQLLCNDFRIQWVIIRCLCVLAGPSSVCGCMPVFVLQLTS